ncbi:MAG: hypothetical protein AB7N76_01540 [Planctomycetota bacterium]
MTSPKLTPASGAPSEAEAGAGLLIVLVFMVTLLAGAMALFGYAGLNTQRSANNRLDAELVSAARSGVAGARLALWERYEAQNGGQAGTKEHYRSWLASTAGLSPDGNGTAVASDFLSLTWTPGDAEGTLVSGEPIAIKVAVTRQDSGDSTFLAISSRASTADGQSRSSELVLRAGGAPFEGFEFALLANNVNCIFCHATIDNVTRAYPGMGVTEHDRIKVAALESVMMRVGSAQSKLAGTLYVNGKLMDKSGTELAVPPAGSGNIQSTPIDAATGKVPASGWSNMQDLVDSMPSQDVNGNFYKDYDPSNPFDGKVPEAFPPVVPSGSDGQISEQEWASHVDTLKAGTLTGGTRVVVPEGATVTFANDLLPRDGSYGSFVEVTPPANATNIPLNPKGNWISQANLKAMYAAENARRLTENQGQKKAYELDGLIYTNNAIFMLSRGSASGNGEMIVNGAVVSADAGILVANGLTLNYDARTKSFLRIEDTTSVALTTVSRRER